MGAEPNVELNAMRDEFVFWNLKLLETFFSRARRGEEVWLQVDPDELDSHGRSLGGDEAFLKAVAAGPPWGTVLRAGRYSHGTHEDLVGRIRGLVLQRRRRNRRPPDYLDPGELSPTYQGKDAPCYLPMLAALVRTAAIAEAGFYPHLRSSLGLASNWHTQNLVAMEHAWQDLEDWTTQTGGEFGRFLFRRLGGFNRIGVPRSQSVIALKDRHSFPKLFNQLGLRADQSLPPDAWREMRRTVLNSGPGGGFSEPFKQAMAIEAYQDIVEAQLKSAFEEWDGLVPADENTPGPGRLSRLGKVGVSLGLSEGNVPPWMIRWRVPPLSESGRVQIRHGDHLWSAPAVGSEPTTTLDDAAAVQGAAVHILAMSARDAVPFSASIAGSSDEGADLGVLVMPPAAFRVLVPRFDGVHQRVELREDSLPGNGPAYLLASSGAAPELKKFLGHERLGWKHVASEGLPEGWTLSCILDCNTLTAKQRSHLSGGNGAQGSPRALRLVGGRSIPTANVRQFLSYDLPSLELDAPEGTSVHAEGLSFDEEAIEEDRQWSIRRYSITQDDQGAGLYEIVALHSGREISRVNLRVASNSGESNRVDASAFGVDSKGWPLRLRAGLRGVLQEESLDTDVGGAITVHLPELGSPAGEDSVGRQLSAPQVLFLDTVAHHGSMGYGPARDQLARLQVRAGQTPDPNTALLDLRARGHIEIETDEKGHFARVYSVEPALYSLAARGGAKRAYAVLGSLRLRQWAAIAEALGAGLRCQDVADGRLMHAWRFVDDGSRDASSRFDDLGLQTHLSPWASVARWAASIDEVYAAINSLAGESPVAGDQIQVLSAATARFRRQEVARVDAELDCQLFKFPDEHAPTLYNHQLGINASSRQRFGFVRDSSWGRWLAMGAFAKYAMSAWGIEHACPWPIPYDAANGSIWLPARLGLPFVLERALVLCSGAPPQVSLLNATLRPGSSVVELKTVDQGRPVGTVSGVYAQFGKARWLRFQWVPEDVATTVARKVGGALTQI